MRVYGGVMSQTVGPLLRSWRRRRNLSQLDLAHRADVSARHLSFIETGRSRPSPDMVLRLCDQLDVPLREQNRLLLASGHAPAHPEHGLGDPSMAEANAAIEAILAAYDPFPALVIDQGWDLVVGERRGLRAARRGGPRAAGAAGQRDPAQPAPATDWPRAS